MKAINIETPVRGLAIVAAIAIASPMMTTGQGKKDGPGPQKIRTSRGGYDVSRFAGQARALGLTPAEAAALQKRVDEVVTETGGMQIDINRVLSKDGSSTTTVPLPDEDVEMGAPYALGPRSPLQIGIDDCCDVYIYSTDPWPTGGLGVFKAYDEILRACDLVADGWWVHVWLGTHAASSDLGGVMDENGSAEGCSEVNLSIAEQENVSVFITLSQDPQAPTEWCCDDYTWGKT